MLDGHAAQLADDLTRWLRASRRFEAFVGANRGKIRKKLRLARDRESLQDVRAELAVAYVLLLDRRTELAFEPYSAGGRRGPDFAVTFRASTIFNVEVTRLRAGADAPLLGGLSVDAGEQCSTNADWTAKIANTICAKLGQLPPGMPNVLALVSGGAALEAPDVADAAGLLKADAERKDEARFLARGLRGTREFHHLYPRLSGAIVLRAVGSVGELDTGGIALWTNKEAKHPLSTELRTLLTGGVSHRK